MQTMYPGKVNSPATTLDGGIDDSVTTINIIDGGVLPLAPNLAVIGIGEDAETILYATKVVNQLSNITRGFQGIAKEWSTGEVISRLFTEYDYNALKGNIETVAGRKITDFGECNSSELRGKITDETGTGKSVFGTYPNITKINLTEGQIKFPAIANPSSDPNTQDDYEEGEWTMGISFGGGIIGVTYDINIGYYTKIGNIVIISGALALTSKGTDTGTALITGLPFPLVSSYKGAIGVALRFNYVKFANQSQGHIRPYDLVIRLEEITEAGVATLMTNANFENNSQIMVNCTYRIG